MLRFTSVCRALPSSLLRSRLLAAMKRGRFKRRRLARRGDFPAAAEVLEDRTLLSTLFVNNGWNFVADNGDGILSSGDAVESANDSGQLVEAEYGIDAYGEVTTGSITGSLPDFDEIQDAVDDSQDGDEVRVLAGNYTETVSIPHNDFTLRGHTGIRTDVVIDGGGAFDDGIRVTGDNVTLADLRVTNFRDEGIEVDGVTDFTAINVQSDSNEEDGLVIGEEVPADTDDDGNPVDQANPVSGVIRLIGVVAEGAGNGAEGLEVGGTGTATVDIVGGSYSGNDDRGIEVRNVETVEITDARASGNNRDGIVLADITARAILTRTTANDNDANGDGLGDGLDATGIGGDLRINGSTFDDTDAAGDKVQQQRGIDVDGVDGRVILEAADPLQTGAAIDVSVTGNDQDGLRVRNVDKGVSISDTMADDNRGDGMSLANVGGVSTINITATGNDSGIVVDGALSFRDTDGNYSNNADHGIRLIDIAGDVTLTRTTANDNDADGDGTGDGFRAEDRGDADNLAIGRDLMIDGGTFDDTDAAGDKVQQVVGVFVEDGIGRRVVIQADPDTGQPVSASGNDGRGIVLANVADTVSISNTTAGDNGGDGLDLSNVGDVTTTNVTAAGNDPGIFVDGALSFRDTDGNYSNNADHGIRLIDIADNVVLTRTTANNNDADGDGTGDGFRAEDRGDADSLAIGRDLMIDGGTFDDTDAAGDKVQQVVGVFVEDGIGQRVVIQANPDTGQPVSASGNDMDGIALADVANDVSISDTTASDNGGDGFAMTSAASAELADLTLQGNADFGGRIDGVPTLIFTATTGPAEDDVTLTADELRHSRDGEDQQPIRYSGVEELEIHTERGDDTITVQTGGLPAAVTLDAGPPSASDEVTVLGTAGPDELTLSGDEISIDGTTITLAEVERLTVNPGDGDDTVTVAQPFSGASEELQIGGGADSDTLIVNTPKDAADVVEIDGDSVEVAGELAVQYGGVEALQVNTGRKDDTITVQTGGLPAAVTLDAGPPSASDEVTVLGTAGPDELTLSGDEISTDGTTITLAEVEELTVEAGAGGDMVTVAQPFNGASEELQIGGGADPDTLIVDTPQDAADVVEIDGDSVEVTGQLAVQYVGMEALQVTTGREDDTITVQTGGLPAAVTLDAGPPSASDEVTVLGTAGPDELTLSGDEISIGGTTITLAEIEELTVEAGDGGDTVTVGPLDREFPSELLVNGGEDNDMLDAAESSLPLVMNGSAGDDRLIGSEHDDLLGGGSDEDRILGTGGADEIRGDSTADEAGNWASAPDHGHDILDGGVGNDSIDGEAGSDLLIGSEGDDNLDGGPGHDIISGDVPARFANADGHGADVLVTVAHDLKDGLPPDHRPPQWLRTFQNKLEEKTDSDGKLEFGFEVLDRLNVPAAKDRSLDDFTPARGQGDDTIHGSGDNDVINGGLGNDEIDGGRGHDVLYGSLGVADVGDRDLSREELLAPGLDDDLIRGGAADESSDALFGSIGRDTLSGGPGFDTLDAHSGGEDVVDQADRGEHVLSIPAEDGFDSVANPSSVSALSSATGLPSLAGTWDDNGVADSATIEQSGTSLTIINRRGRISAGHFVGSNEIVATDWNDLHGTLDGDRIRWDNGVIWKRSGSPESLPDLAGTWDDNGVADSATIEQSGTSLTIINRRGRISAGHFVGSNEIVATDWNNLHGTLEGDRIRWDNGVIWERSGSPESLPDLAGTWDDNGVADSATIEQSGTSLTIINRRGRISAGHFVGSNEIVATDWNNLHGTLEGDRIRWDNGVIWERSSAGAGTASVADIDRVFGGAGFTVVSSAFSAPADDVEPERLTIEED